MKKKAARPTPKAPATKPQPAKPPIVEAPPTPRAGDEPAQPTELQDRVLVYLRRLDWDLIGMILAIKALFYIYGTQAFQALTNSDIGGFDRWLTIWNHWDATHYIDLAQNGYQTVGDQKYWIIFYPLFPWLIRVVAVVFDNYIISALIVVAVASIAAGLLLRQLVKLDYSEQIANNAVWFLFIFPGSAALHTPFTESLFLALAIGSFLTARKGRWASAGVLGALACLTRINGIVLMPALAIEAGHQFWKTRRWRWEWLWIGFMALGILAYLWLNYHVFGDAFTFMTFRREHFFQRFSWPWVGIKDLALGMRQTGEAGVVRGVQDFFFVMLGLAGTVWSFIKLRPSYAVWMAGNWLLFTSTTFILGAARFSVILFPLFIVFSLLSMRKVWYAAITVWSLLFLALFTGIYVEGHFVY
jgi:Mannosyltransferase (PIG-V)